MFPPLVYSPRGCSSRSSCTQELLLVCHVDAEIQDLGPFSTVFLNHKQEAGSGSRAAPAWDGGELAC